MGHSLENTFKDPTSQIENPLRVLIVEANKYPYEAVINNELSSLQKEVGGYIEIIPLAPNIDLICNEEGKLIGLEGNRSLGNDIITGTFFIAGSNDEGSLISLTNQQIQKYTQKFKEPESFTKEQIEEVSGFIFLS